MTTRQEMAPGWLAALIAFSVVTVFEPASASECMRFDGKAERAAGALGVGAFQDDADRPESAFILTLPAPTCLDAVDPEFRVKDVRTIHIFGADDAVHTQIEKLSGESVVVHGRPFGAHTSHHHAPIVMEVVAIDRQ